MFSLAINWGQNSPPQMTSDEQKLLLSAKDWLFSFSGGGDSVLAFYFCLSWLNETFTLLDKDKKNLRLTLLYFNHQLPYSQEEQQGRLKVIQSALTAARQLNFTVRFLEADIHARKLAKHNKYSFEFCASQMRRRFIEHWARRNFQKTQNPCVVVSGHSLSDWYETVIMRLQRGTSLQKLLPLPVCEEVKNLKENTAMSYYRPLAFHYREEIRETLNLNRLSFWQDPSNEDTAIERNFVRQNFLPYRKSGLRKSAQNFLTEKKKLERQEQELLKKIPWLSLKNLGDIELARHEIHADYAALQKLSVPQQLQVKTFFLKQLGLGPLSRELKKQLIKNSFVRAPYCMEIENWHEKIVLVIRRGNVNLHPKTKLSKPNFFCASEADPHASIHFVYGRKKLKKVFSELKISKRQRNIVFLQGTKKEITEIDLTALGLKKIKAYESL